jgi:hypothetical protein
VVKDKKPSIGWNYDDLLGDGSRPTGINFLRATMKSTLSIVGLATPPLSQSNQSPVESGNVTK